MATRQTAGKGKYYCYLSALDHSKTSLNHGTYPISSDNEIQAELQRHICKAV